MIAVLVARARAVLGGRQRLTGAVARPHSIRTRLRACLAGADVQRAARPVVAGADVAVGAAGLACRIGGACRIGTIDLAVAIVVEMVGAGLGAGQDLADAFRVGGELAGSGTSLRSVVADAGIAERRIGRETCAWSATRR